MTTRRVFSLLFLAFLSASSHAYSITSFPSSAYNVDTNVMNSTLGIDGTYVVEDFEDSTLIAGLTITDHADGIGSPSSVSNAVIVWDGSTAMAAGLGPAHPIDDPIFSFSQTVMRFGIGISDYQSAFYGLTQILVNGTNIGAIPFDDTLRDGYLFITAGNGEGINSVTFLQSNNDAIMYDHLAVQYAAVPIPSSLLLMGLGILVFRTAQRRRILITA